MSDLTGELRIALARAVASHRVDDSLLEDVAQRLAEVPDVDLARGIGICTHGICVDYFLRPDDWREKLFGLLDGPFRIRRLDVFPWGIIEDDLYQVKVEYQVDELVQVAVPAPRRGLG